MTDSELAKILTEKESTTELGQYWAKRYEKFLKDKLFVVSDKTLDLIRGSELLSTPDTPFGHLNLVKFISKNKAVDEIYLQNAIETAVRFLDSALDIINFNDEAKQVIFQYRKIGIGVMNFDQYLNLRGSTSEVDEIDYLGNIISSSAYRASEALSEEKGVCENWDSIKTMVRPKAFEYWYNSNTGEIKNGLDISEEYSQETVNESFFEILPRRNSNMLIYPAELEWKVWADRIEENSQTLDSQEPGQILRENQTDTNEIQTTSNPQFTATDNDQELTVEESTSTSQSNQKNTAEMKNSNSISSLIGKTKTKIGNWFGVNEQDNNTTSNVDVSQVISDTESMEIVQDSNIKNSEPDTNSNVIVKLILLIQLN